MTEFIDTPEDRTIMQALSINREIQVRAAEEVALEYASQLGAMATQETLESQLAGIALDYQAEREQLPLAGDSKKTLKRKMQQRIAWALETGNSTRSGARMYSGDGIIRDGLVIFHRTKFISDPPLLFEPEPDVYSGIRQGWTVEYSDIIDADDPYEGPPDIWQYQINPENRGVRLEIGFAARSSEDEKTLSYNALYQVTASRRKNSPDKLEVTEDGASVVGDNLLFPMGLVLQATKEIKAKSPYSSAPKKLKRQIARDDYYFSLDKILQWPKQKLSQKRTS